MEKNQEYKKRRSFTQWKLWPNHVKISHQKMQGDGKILFIIKDFKDPDWIFEYKLSIFPAHQSNNKYSKLVLTVLFFMSVPDEGNGIVAET